MLRGTSSVALLFAFALVLAGCGGCDYWHATNACAPFKVVWVKYDQHRVYCGNGKWKNFG